jgi:hypothetical protein
LNARAKSSIDSFIPIDNIIPPRAGAYNSFDTLKTLNKLKIQFFHFYTISLIAKGQTTPKEQKNLKNIITLVQ